jgi:hypothetical protein
MTPLEEFIQELDGIIDALLGKPAIDLYGGDLGPGSKKSKEVRQLQHDLAVLGFSCALRDQKGRYDRYTTWAVREFQIATKMDFI